MKYISKRMLLVGVMAFSVLVTGCSSSTPEKNDIVSAKVPVAETQKVYVALEGDGAVAVIDVPSMTLSKKISLTTDKGNEFMAHNVQVAPDGKSVWVTANAMEKDMHGFRFVPTAFASEGESKDSTLESQLVVIDPATDTIQKRIPLGMGLGLAHVTLTPDSNTVIATSQKKGIVFLVNVKTGEVVKKITLDMSSEPHGVRVLPDSSKAYVALMKGNGMAEIDLQNFSVSVVPMKGSSVQIGVTPDGKQVVASLYDTKKMAVYTLGTKEVREIALPESSKGPLQMYPTPDSKYMYLADQGYYSKQPEGEKVYKIDLQNSSIITEILAGKAPHGVVVSPDGKYVFVTNLMDKNVSVIDTATDKEITKVRVGKEPNGISFWSSKTGGTP